jgi:AcrR family transcriptional regulator
LRESIIKRGGEKMDTAGRNDRTKNALASALARAMEKKPIQKISVQELADACGIRRQTFYYHFPDVYALLEWTLERDRAAFSREQASMLCWQEYVLMLLKFMSKNRKRYVGICSCMGWRFIERFYRGELGGVAEKAVAYYLSGRGADAKYMDFLTAFCTSSLLSLMGSWMLGEIDRTPEELVADLDTLVRDAVRGAEQRQLFSGEEE